VRLSQRRIEALLAHAARLAALAPREPMAARRALELSSGRRMTLSAEVERRSFRPAPHAFFAKDLLTLHADSGHERPRLERKNWAGFVIAAETGNGNRSANARGRTTVTIRIAMQPPC